MNQRYEYNLYLLFSFTIQMKLFKIMKEVKSLTGIRGIAALYVIFYHFFVVFQPERLLIHDHISTFISHGYIAVDLFFILSAYVLCFSAQKNFSNKIEYSKYLEFMKNRFSRVYPLYFVCLVFAIGFFAKTNHPFNILKHILLLQIPFSTDAILAPAWSLSVEWWIYLFFPFIFRIIFKSNNAIKFLLIVLSIVILFYIGSREKNFLHGGDLDIYFGITPLFRGICDYVIGVIIFFVPQRVKLKNQNMICLIILFLIAILLCIPHTDVVLIELFAMLILTLSKENEFILSRIFNNKLVYFLGLISYSMYLTHIFVMDYFKSEFSNQYFYLSCIIQLAIIVAISYMTYRLIEKNVSQSVKKILSSKSIGGINILKN